MAANHIYVGIKGTVLALDRSSGVVVWQTGLSGGTFVNLADDGDRVYALSQGEAFCLDARDGRILWKNPLKGFGLGLGSILVPGNNNSHASAAVAQIRSNQQAAAATAAGSAS